MELFEQPRVDHCRVECALLVGVWLNHFGELEVVLLPPASVIDGHSGLVELFDGLLCGFTIGGVARLSGGVERANACKDLGRRQVFLAFLGHDFVSCLEV